VGENSNAINYSFQFSDSAMSNLAVADVLINNALDGRRACYLAYVPSSASGTSGVLYLVDDGGDAGGPYAGYMVFANGSPTGASINNSQCSIATAGTSIAGTATTLTLTLAVTFSAAFTGNQVVYMAAREGVANSGWQSLAVWTPSNLTSPAAAVSASPSRLAKAAGASQLGTFTFSDTGGWQHLTVVDILINSAINGIGACYLAYVPAQGAGSNGNGVLYLVDDSGDAGGPYAGALALPTTSTTAIANRQCSVDGSQSSFIATGNTLTLTLALTFTPSFAGNQVVYLSAQDSAGPNSGWQSLATSGQTGIAGAPAWTSLLNTGTWKAVSALNGVPSETFNVSPSTAPSLYLTFPPTNIGAYGITYKGPYPYTVTASTECGTHPPGATGGTLASQPWWAISLSSAAAPFFCPSSPAAQQSGSLAGYITSCAADVTGCPTFNFPLVGYRRGNFKGARGIQFYGAFNDGSWPNSTIPGQVIQEVVFFHQQNCYYGGIEYGFKHDVITGSLAFYWGTNKNCGGYNAISGDNSFNGSRCRNAQYPAGSVVYEDYSSYNSSNLPPLYYLLICPSPPQAGASCPLGSNYRFIAYVFQDTDSRLKFKVQVLNPDLSVYNDGQELESYCIDPNTAPGSSTAAYTSCSGNGPVIPDWFPISSLYGAPGYVTMTVQRTDANNQQNPTTPPSIGLKDIQVGK